MQFWRGHMLKSVSCLVMITAACEPEVTSTPPPVEQTTGTDAAAPATASLAPEPEPEPVEEPPSSDAIAATSAEDDGPAMAALRDTRQVPTFAMQSIESCVRAQELAAEHLFRLRVDASGTALRVTVEQAPKHSRALADSVAPCVEKAFAAMQASTSSAVWEVEVLPPHGDLWQNVVMSTNLPAAPDPFPSVLMKRRKGETQLKEAGVWVLSYEACLSRAAIPDSQGVEVEFEFRGQRGSYRLSGGPDEITRCIARKGRARLDALLRQQNIGPKDRGKGVSVFALQPAYVNALVVD